MTGTELQLLGCAKTFAGDTKALLPTDLVVKPGEILGLLGPSGCGKTTMLRIMAGLETPDSGGKILFDDEDVTKVPIEHRSIGMVFQSYALFPNMSVQQNVGYGLKVRGISGSERDDRVNEVMSFCRLDGLADRAINQLSGGQRQRVALARAVAPRPRVLLLDEPLSALDAALRDTLRDELAVILRGLSMTAVFVTHDQSEAMAIADTIAVMRAGRIEQRAAPEVLYRDPQTDFVASFVGGANRLSGRFENGQLHLEGGTLKTGIEGQQPDHIFIRQEDVRITNPDGASLRGKVIGRVYLGTHTKLTISGVCEAPLMVTLQGANAPKIGDLVGLDIPAISLIHF